MSLQNDPNKWMLNIHCLVYVAMSWSSGIKALEREKSRRKDTRTDREGEIEGDI